MKNTAFGLPPDDIFPSPACTCSGCSVLILFGDTDSFSFALKFLGKKGPLFSGENPN